MFSSEKSGGIFMAAMVSDNLSPWQTMMSNDSNVNSQPENIGQDLPLSLDNPLGSAVDSLVPNVGERIDEVKDKIDESVSTLPEESATPTDEVVTDSKPADEKAVSENSAVEPEVVEDKVLLEPAMSKELVLNSGMYYFYGDHLGSSSVVTDSTGKVVQTTDYYPYGGVRHEFTDESFENDFLYTGKEFDEELGVYYYGARYYNADIGRFMGIDPISLLAPQKLIGDPQAFNYYAYGRNNPIRYIDPNGQSSVEAMLGYVVGIGTGALNTAVSAGYAVIFPLQALANVASGIYNSGKQAIELGQDLSSNWSKTTSEIADGYKIMANEFLNQSDYEMGKDIGNVTEKFIEAAIIKKVGEKIVIPGKTNTSSLAEKIANGHAYEKHVINEGQFPGMFKNQDDFAVHIDSVVNNPTLVKNLSRDRTAYWSEGTNTVVIVDPKSVDGGTAFQPSAGKTYFDKSLK